MSFRNRQLDVSLVMSHTSGRYFWEEKKKKKENSQCAVVSYQHVGGWA
jgi:hypothetical protein